MMALLKTLIWGPEPPPPSYNEEVQTMRAELVQELIDVKRTSSEIRRQIASETLGFIARKN